MKKFLVLAIGLALMGQGCLASRGTLIVSPPVPIPAPQPVACTMDAKQCPDGSYVGRTGPLCEFVCPPTPTPVPETSEQNMPPQAPTPKPTPPPTPIPKPSASTFNVSIQNFAFGPKSITVKKGDKIIFQNRDTVGHTATSDTGKFDSGMLATGASFTLDTSNLAPGSYPYHCTPHPNMTATIIVQ